MQQTTVVQCAMLLFRSCQMIDEFITAHLLIILLVISMSSLVMSMIQPLPRKLCFTTNILPFTGDDLPVIRAIRSKQPFCIDSSLTLAKNTVYELSSSILLWGTELKVFRRCHHVHVSTLWSRCCTQ